MVEVDINSLATLPADCSYEQKIRWPTEELAVLSPDDRYDLSLAAWCADQLRHLGQQKSDDVTDPRLIAEALRIEIQSTKLIGVRGQLYYYHSPNSEKSCELLILIGESHRDAQDSELDVLVTVAHEIGHAFFLDWGPGRIPFSTLSRLAPWRIEEERWCNYFALRLLCPGRSGTEQEALDWLARGPRRRVTISAI